MRASVVRLPPTVHGAGDHAFVPRLIQIAREKGISAYVGDGSNRWPAVHRFDAARLYRLLVEKDPASGAYHGVAEEGVPFRDIAQLIGRRLNLPVASVTPEQAPDHFGFLAAFVAIDNPTSSEKTRGVLGWTPTHPGLLADIDQHYF